MIINQSSFIDSSAHFPEIFWKCCCYRVHPIQMIRLGRNIHWRSWTVTRCGQEIRRNTYLVYLRKQHHNKRICFIVLPKSLSIVLDDSIDYCAMGVRLCEQEYVRLWNLRSYLLYSNLVECTLGKKGKTHSQCIHRAKTGKWKVRCEQQKSGCSCCHGDRLQGLYFLHLVHTIYVDMFIACVN